MTLMRSLFFLLFSLSCLSLLAQGQLQLTFNGKVLPQEQFRSMVLCGDGHDSLQVTFVPASPPAAGTRYAIPQVELWGQVRLGQPTRLGILNPAEYPRGFELRDLLGAGGLPPSRDAMRVSLRIGRVLFLEKGLVKQQIPLQEGGYLRFLVVSQCR